METEDIIGILIGLVFLFVGGCAGFSFGEFSAEESMKKEAVEAEVAEFYLNEDNEKQFRYLKPEPTFVFAPDDHGDNPLPQYRNGNSDNSSNSNNGSK